MAPAFEMHLEVISSIKEFKKTKIEPVGKWFEIYYANQLNDQLNHLTLSDDSNLDDDDLSEKEEFGDNSDYLRKLDPRDWKNQDHYAVLGLEKKRFQAKDEDIKKAYRKIVLRHHPDKRSNAGEDIKDLDHDYFSCITKAYEILGNTSKRQSYDSVDPEFDDDVPPSNNYSKENFFELFEPVFKLNSRWSVKQPVPKLGGKNSTVKEVDKFYSFWFDFDSWREFSYLDEEEKEKGENREERRWIEKQNKVARQKRKKDEMARIRQLVENAYACDPRILRFKEEEKQRKLAQKKAKEDAARLRKEEEEKRKKDALEAAKKQKEKEEHEAKQKREKEKKEKEYIKRSLKREKKILQQLCEENNYFASDEKTKVYHMTEMDKLCELLSLEQLQNFNSCLQHENDGARKDTFLQQVQSLNEQLELEKQQTNTLTQQPITCDGKNGSQKPWSHDDLQLLVKGVNLFPAGTTDRWEVIVAFLSQHSPTKVERTAKEVLAKAKELQKRSGGLKEHVNKSAFENLEKNQKQVPVTVKDQSAPTERFDGVGFEPWTAEEQQLLEQALKTFPSSTEERWDKIAACVPGRDKKECVKRYKDLVEMVKAKKAALATASQKKNKV